MKLLELSKNVVPNFELPLQHSHPNVLKSINRPWQSSLNESILEKIREEIPSALLRTSLIVGFLGEKNILNIFSNFWIGTNLITRDYFFSLGRKCSF